MTGLLFKLAISLTSILALAATARWLKLGGDARIADEAEARRLAREVECDFEAEEVVLDRAGMGALLRDAQGRQMLIRRHGAHFVGRLLDRTIEARLDRNFLTIGTGEASFGSVTLDLGPHAQHWAAGLRHLPGATS